MISKKSSFIISAICIILLCTILLFINSCGPIDSMMAKSLIYPRRQPLVKNPADYGMPYEDVEFITQDSVTLKAWWIPGDDEKIIVMTHPMPFTRYGFSPKHQGFFKVTKLEVELLKTVRHLHDQGYNVLTFDFRNHGESAEGDGGVCCVGLNEWQDVAGALDYIAGQPDLSSMPVAFVSHCMGANATIIAMSKASDKFANVKCLVAVQPVSMDVLVPCMIQDKYPLFSSRVNAINKKVMHYTGHTLDEMSPENYVGDIRVPVLYVQVKNDPWTRPSDIQSIFDKTHEPKKLLWIEGNERFDGYNYFGDHPEKLLQFLDSNF
ncbi:alpha/beta hydrolase [bacterium]|nr:alpha/beta hydrolase [bacterium]